MSSARWNASAMFTGAPRFGKRALLCIVLAWVPLVVLVLVEATARSFATDVAVNARLLLAIPLCVAAARIGAPWLGAIANHFVESGIIAERDHEKFEAIVLRIRRIRTSVPATAALIVIAYTLIAVLALRLPDADFPQWQLTQTAWSRRFSLAGWWHLLVSLPLLFVLFLGGVWRLFLWAWFLWLVARLDLRLLPAHPDRSAGLRFVTHSVRATGPLAAAAGVMMAGTVANEVLHHAQSFLQYRFVIAGFVAIVLAICAGPPLVLTRKLLTAWRRGVFEYGALANDVGRQFEQRWVRHTKSIDDTALESPAFSATADLFSVVANVYQMRVLLLDAKSLGVLASAAVLPFVPLAVATAPVADTLAKLASLLL